jgi:hypothetical protein
MTRARRARLARPVVVTAVAVRAGPGRIGTVRIGPVSAGLWIVLGSAILIGPAGAAAAPVPSASAGLQPSQCAPQRQYRHCLRYGFTGDDQSFTVPGRVRSLRVLEWGAGGGGASAGRPQYSAGAGGFTAGDVAVHPGEQLTVSVGQGGYTSGTGWDQIVYGGGGFGGNGVRTGGSGGGMSSLWQGAYATTPILIAGGGGGASPGSQTAASPGPHPAVIGGGGGGGLGGGWDGTEYSGQGGGQYGGGSPGGPPVPCDGSGIGGTAPTGGQQYSGGNGAGSDPDPPRKGAVAAGGGGGGGGYFGGGGGTCQVYVTSHPNGAGGGGSGYLEDGNVTHASTIAGRDGIAAGLDQGTPPAGAAMRSPFYRPDLGWGGGRSGAGNGGNGQIVIEWGVRPAPSRSVPSRSVPSRSAPSRPAPHSPPVPRQRPAPAPGSPLAGGHSAGPGRRLLPRTGFPFLQVGIVAVILIGLGVGVTWAGGRRPEG